MVDRSHAGIAMQGQLSVNLAFLDTVRQPPTTPSASV